MRCEERQEEAETKREFDMWLIDISALRCGVWLADESFAELHSLISIWRVAWGRVTTPDYAACAHTHTQTHTHTHTHNVDCHRLHLSPSLEKSKDVKLQGVTCTKLSSFLNVNIYKQLRTGERGIGVIEDKKEGRRREKRVGIV